MIQGRRGAPLHVFGRIRIQVTMVRYMEGQGSARKDRGIAPSRGIKAIVLLSGGLDSAVAARLMQEQGLDLVALNFHSPFCTCASNMKYNGCSATFFAAKMNIPIMMLAKGDDYLAIIKHPRFGYGKHMNPCIDCRIYLFKKAMELLPELGARFIITGEVLGQRPKSQMRRALEVIDKESGASGYVLRPLSAKLLPPTIPEQNGWVDREKLLSIEGRQRNMQVELGKKYNLIKQYCAGGGCLLTDSSFSVKLRDYFEHVADTKMDDMQYLKIGRHFRCGDVKIIVGRNEYENFMLESLISPFDYIISLKDAIGPSTLVRFSEMHRSGIDLLSIDKDAVLRWAGEATCKYSKSSGTSVVVTIKAQGEELREMAIPCEGTPVLDAHRIGTV